MLGRVVSDIWRSMFRRAQAPVIAADGAPGLAQAAYAALAIGKRELAIECAERALDRDAEYHDARRLLADLYLGGRNYEDVIADIHRHLKPRTYVEIGVAAGGSLRLSGPETLVLGVDPDPAIDFELSPNMRVFRETSDQFFAARDVRAELGGRGVELAFIDGMHWFDYALRDFINLERLCSSGATILVHDCFPLDRVSAQRERKSNFWSGDVWRLVVLLKKWRPDLRIHTIATPPTGLAMIRGLDPASRILPDNLERLTAEFLQLDYAYLHGDRAAKLNAVPNDWATVRGLLDEPLH